MSEMPKVRLEDGMFIGRASGRILVSRWRYFRRRAACLFLGHDWSPWQVDDYEGPGEVSSNGIWMVTGERARRGLEAMNN